MSASPGTLTAPVLSLVVGVGSSRGVRPAAVWSALRLAVPDLTTVTAFGTIDRRRDEPGLLAVIRELGVPLYCYPAAELDAVDVPHPSEPVRDHVGTRSVAEAAALLAARDLGGGELIVPKLRGEHVTVAVAALHPLSISAACTACGGCLRTCPEHALRPAPARPLVVAARCTSCGECVEICPTDAITLRDEYTHAHATLDPSNRQPQSPGSDKGPVSNQGGAFARSVLTEAGVALRDHDADECE